MNSWFDLDQWQNEQIEDAGKFKWYFKLFIALLQSILSPLYSGFLNGMKLQSSLILQSTLSTFTSFAIPPFLNGGGIYQ